MKKILKITYWGSAAFIFLIFFIAAILGSLMLSYFLGWQLLGGIMMGSDSAFALTVMTYLDKWFPRIPLWYPFQGAGQSITLGYYTLMYYIPLILHRMSDLGLVQAMRLVAFLSVPLIAVELFVYSVIRLKNPTIGLVAALLYPISSAAWAWQTHGGFYAMTLSLVWLAPAFTMYDWWLDLKMRRDKNIGKSRLVLILAVIFVGMALVSHLAVGAALLLGMAIYTLLRSQLLPLKWHRLKSPLIGLGCLLSVMVLAIAFSSWLFIPQRYYTGEIAQDIIPVYGPDIPQLKLSAFLGIDRHEPEFDSIYQPMFMSVVVTVLAGMGTIMGLIKRHFMGGVGLTVFILAYITSITKWINSLGQFFAVLMLPTNVRLAAFVFILAPVVAAYGVWSLAEIVPWIVSRILQLVQVKSKYIHQPLLFLGGTLFAIPIFLYTVNYFKTYQRWSGGASNQFDYYGFGPMGVAASFCLIKELSYPAPLGKSCPVPPWPPIIDEAGRDPLPEINFAGFATTKGFDQFTRYDVSLNLGSFTATANLHTDASMINSYNGIGALIYIWWGHQTRAMYLPEGNTHEAEELARHFGIRYVFLQKGIDPIDRYPDPPWEDTGEVGSAIVKELKDAPPLASLWKGPVILVIGDHDKNAYEQVFRIGYKGALGADEAILVQGKENIDDYQQNELDRFDMIILHGYHYRRQNRAFKLLEKYVKNGGALYINTGWQYEAADWGKTPLNQEKTEFGSTLSEPFPITYSRWGSIGTSWIEFKLDKEIFADIKVNNFANPEVDGRPWQMAYATKDALASWAKPLFYNQNTVVMAGGILEKGKVIWSGMNFLAHAYDRQSLAEIEMLKASFHYLLGEPTGEEAVAVSSSRSFPDTISFSLNKTENPSWLYFREAYTRSWHPLLDAGMTKKRVALYKAGPGLTLIYLPLLAKSGNLKLTFSMGLLQPLASAVTLLTLLFLIGFWLEGTVGKRKLELALGRKIIVVLNRLRSKVDYEDE